MQNLPTPSRRSTTRFVFFIIVAVGLGFFLAFGQPKWLQGVGELNTIWKVIAYIIIMGLATVFYYWPAGSKLSDIQREDRRKIFVSYAIVALIALVIFGLLGWYISATT